MTPNGVSSPKRILMVKICSNPFLIITKKAWISRSLNLRIICLYSSRWCLLNFWNPKASLNHWSSSWSNQWGLYTPRVPWLPWKNCLLQLIIGHQSYSFSAKVLILMKEFSIMQSRWTSKIRFSRKVWVKDRKRRLLHSLRMESRMGTGYFFRTAISSSHGCPSLSR